MAKVKAPMIWVLTSETKAENGETVFTYMSGQNIVKFQAGTSAFSWLIYSSTNVPVRLRNKVIDSYISTRGKTKEYKTIETM